MTDELIRKLDQPPIRNKLMYSTDNGDEHYHENWVNWLNSISNYLNFANYYGYPSILLNSDFNFQRAITTPITQADGDAAFFAEKWQINGAAAATYTITSTVYSATDKNQSGSVYYENFAITAWSGVANTFYAYQQHDGAEFLRKYQNRNIAVTAYIKNNSANKVKLKVSMYFYYDTGTELIDGRTFAIREGFDGVIATKITTPLMEGKTIGASPYVQFRLTLTELNTSADFDVQYIKAELSDLPTILYVDHWVEETRIDNA